jgi:hypothetical protein
MLDNDSLHHEAVTESARTVARVRGGAHGQLPDGTGAQGQGQKE